MKPPEYGVLLMADIEARPSRHDKTEARRLADSLERDGLMHPLTVVPKGKRFHLTAGAGRFAAAKLLGWTKIPCLVFPHAPESPEEKLLFVDENIERLELPQQEIDDLLRARRALIEKLHPESKRGRGRPPKSKTPPRGWRQRMVTVDGERMSIADYERSLGGEPLMMVGETHEVNSAPGAELTPGVRPINSTAQTASAAGISTRAAQEAFQREKAPATVSEAFARGDLGKKQVTILQRLSPEEQEKILPTVVGKGKAETERAVKAAVAESTGLDRNFAQFGVLLKDLERQCRALCGAAESVVAKAGEVGISDLHGMGAVSTKGEVLLAVSALHKICQLFAWERGGPDAGGKATSIHP